MDADSKDKEEMNERGKRPRDMSADVGAAVVTGIFAFGVGSLSFGITLLRDRSAAKQTVMQFLTDKRQQLASDTDLLNVIHILKQEQEAKHGNASPPNGPTNHHTGSEWRKLPAFLEPIGIFLEYNPATFPKAYGVFSEEVLLCAESSLLWEPDQRYNQSVYWNSFSKFVGSTRKAGYSL